MRIDWIIDDGDVARVKEFLAAHRGNSFVRKRIERNLAADKKPVPKACFWRWMIGCLLTTQQRSGPGSAVYRFIHARPFPLPYARCSGRDDPAGIVVQALGGFGGLRRTTRIADEVAANLAFLDGGGWGPTRRHLDAVRLRSSPRTEGEAADFLADHLAGIGPKQSRNLLQVLGLSRYEVPIDSRLARWLNEFGFPFVLSASALGDRNYYRLVSEGFRRLAMAAGVKPCVLDAAIFASYDGDGWAEGEEGY